MSLADEASPADRLSNLKEDIDDIFYAFENLLVEANRLKCPSVQEKERLAVLRQHLKQPSAGSLSSQAKQLEESAARIPGKGNGFSGANAAQFLVKITEKLEKISDLLVARVEEVANKSREAESKSSELQVEAENHRAQYESLQKRLLKATSEKNSSVAVMETMKKQLEERNEMIARLNREKTVQLWQKEKKRVLKEAAERETALTAELTALKEQVRDTKDRSSSRLQRMNEDLKKEKMRADLRIRETLEEDDPMVVNDSVKRQLYMAEQKIVTCCDEVKSQQKLMVGAIGGIRTDYRIVKSRWKQGEPSTAGDDFSELLDVLYESSAAGTMDTVRADLPTYYQCLPADITGFPPRLGPLMRRLSTAHMEEVDKLPTLEAPTKLKPLSFGRRTSLASKTDGDDGPLSPTSEALQHSQRLRKLSATGVRKPSDSFMTMPPIFSSGSSAIGSTSVDETVPDGGTVLAASRCVSRKSSRKDLDHPALINPTTGLPNVKEAVNLFPELNDAQVRVHFSRFMTYDKNRDYSLDREEVKSALTEIRGSSIDDVDFEAAFKELDTDKSGTLDFYEYLVLNRLLLHNAGQAHLFKETRRFTTRGQISKACILQ